MLQIMKNLRVFAVMILGGILAACSQHVVESADGSGFKICDPSLNLVVCYFSDAYFQSGDVEESRREVIQALKDALVLPLEELRAKRYADYQMTPNQWTFGKLLNSYYSVGVRMNGNLVHAENEGFLEALKQPEAIPALKKAITKLEEK